MKAWSIALAFGLLVSGPANAAELPVQVAGWYEALGKADATAFSALLADDVRIQLEDFGVTQDKAEFIESLGNWQEALGSGRVEFRADTRAPEEAGKAVAIVCYRFASNAQMTRETFMITDGRIVGQHQKTLAENCDGF